VEEALSILSPPRSVLLPVSAPFHSRLMKDAEEKLSYDLDYVEFKDLNFPIVTNVDAKIIRSGDEARNALKRQVSHPVLWYESMGILEKEGIELYIELGSGKVLSGLIKRIGRRWASSPATFNIDGPESLKSALEKFF